MNELTINLQKGKKPYYEQIYDYIKSEIQNGNLNYNEKLPSTRKLAQYLCLSRSTVDMAYEQLLSEGYIESIPCRGYYVCKVEELYQIGNSIINSEINKHETEDKYEYDFSLNGIELDHFPFASWRKITKDTLNDDKKELFQLGSPLGEFSLRATISNYLYRARGVKCTPEHIIIGAGNDYLLLLLGQILGRDRIVAMENPTYKQAYKNFLSLGYKVCPVEMDKNGIKVEELDKSNAHIVYVMPSHQFPLGIVMPITRRMELLKWSKKNKNRYIIEDDYDSEFRYKGKPIPSLQGYDSDSKVIYLGTFSKSIAPAIRVSYMVLPDELMKIYMDRYSFYSSTVSRIDQKILDSFIKDGYYERHLNRMRGIYKNKRDILINEIKSIGDDISISGENAGLHILVNIKTNYSSIEVINRLKKEDVRVYSMDEYLILSNKKEKECTILIGYATIDEEKIIEGVRRIKKVLNG